MGKGIRHEWKREKAHSCTGTPGGGGEFEVVIVAKEANRELSEFDKNKKSNKLQSEG